MKMGQETCFFKSLCRDKVAEGHFFPMGKNARLNRMSPPCVLMGERCWRLVEKR